MGPLTEDCYCFSIFNNVQVIPLSCPSMQLSANNENVCSFPVLWGFFFVFLMIIKYTFRVIVNDGSVSGHLCIPGYNGNYSCFSVFIVQ